MENKVALKEYVGQGGVAITTKNNGSWVGTVKGIDNNFVYLEELLHGEYTSFASNPSVRWIRINPKYGITKKKAISLDSIVDIAYFRDTMKPLENEIGPYPLCAPLIFGD